MPTESVAIICKRCGRARGEVSWGVREPELGERPRVFRFSQREAMLAAYRAGRVGPDSKRVPFGVQAALGFIPIGPGWKPKPTRRQALRMKTPLVADADKWEWDSRWWRRSERTTFPCECGASPQRKHSWLFDEAERIRAEGRGQAVEI
jgi:hypothetical protein